MKIVQFCWVSLQAQPAIWPRILTQPQISSMEGVKRSGAYTRVIDAGTSEQEDVLVTSIEDLSKVHPVNIAEIESGQSFCHLSGALSAKSDPIPRTSHGT